jgi:lauroyl/myristoyl acyltransferase
VAPRGRISHRLEFLVVWTFSFLISLLPRKEMVKMGRFFGGMGYRLWNDRRRIAMSNLRSAFQADKTREGLEWIAKEAFKNIGASVLELGWGMRRMNRSVFLRTV